MRIKNEHTTIFGESKQKPETEVYYDLLEKPVITGPNKAKHLNVVLIGKGEGLVKIDGTQYLVGKGNVVVVFPGQLFSCELEEGTLAHHLRATKKVYEVITSISSIPVGKTKPISYFQLSDEAFLLLLHELAEIKKISASDLQGKNELMISRFKTSFLMLKTACLTERSIKLAEKSNPIIDKFIRLIELKYKTERSVVYYAEELNVTANYLFILSKASFEQGPKQLIKNRLVQESKRLLMETDLNIKEISYELGFSGNSGFSTFFKKETGFCPKDFLQLKSMGFHG